MIKQLYDMLKKYNQYVYYTETRDNKGEIIFNCGVSFDGIKLEKNHILFFDKDSDNSLILGDVIEYDLKKLKFKRVLVNIRSSVGEISLFTS